FRATGRAVALSPESRPRAPRVRCRGRAPPEAPCVVAVAAPCVVGAGALWARCPEDASCCSGLRLVRVKRRALGKGERQCPLQDPGGILGGCDLWCEPGPAGTGGVTSIVSAAGGARGLNRSWGSTPGGGGRSWRARSPRRGCCSGRTCGRRGSRARRRRRPPA